ncbi:MAG: FAD-dependent oxidoreductase [Methanobacteriota archaeon]|nr:MAG: FAD-dependent oxidoreductase [Euryarchaeota archaeon]
MCRAPWTVAAAWDAVIVGGGHNGLVSAAYLAKAGLKVLVLERRPIVGGFETLSSGGSATRSIRSTRNSSSRFRTVIRSSCGTTPHGTTRNSRASRRKTPRPIPSTWRSGPRSWNSSRRWSSNPRLRCLICSGCSRAPRQKSWRSDSSCKVRRTSSTSSSSPRRSRRCSPPRRRSASPRGRRRRAPPSCSGTCCSTRSTASSRRSGTRRAAWAAFPKRSRKRPSTTGLPSTRVPRSSES